MAAGGNQIDLDLDSGQRDNIRNTLDVGGASSLTEQGGVGGRRGRRVESGGSGAVAERKGVERGVFRPHGSRLARGEGYFPKPYPYRACFPLFLPKFFHSRSGRTNCLRAAFLRFVSLQRAEADAYRLSDRFLTLTAKWAAWARSGAFSH